MPVKAFCSKRLIVVFLWCHLVGRSSDDQNLFIDDGVSKSSFSSHIRRFATPKATMLDYDELLIDGFCYLIGNDASIIVGLPTWPLSIHF